MRRVAGTGMRGHAGGGRSGSRDGVAGLASRSGSSAGVPSIAGGVVSTASSALAQVGARLRAMGGVAGERAMDQVDQPDRQRRSQVAEIGGIALEAGERGVGVGLAQERHATGEAFVQHERQRVEVGAPVEPAAPDLLGRQVLGGSHHHVVAGEIVSAMASPLAMPKSVSSTRPSDVTRMLAGLDVAVHEAGTMGLVERRRHRRPDVDGELGAEPLLPVEQLAQALAVDELHHHRLAAVVHEHVVDGDDVGMVQPGDGDRFAPEPFGDDRDRWRGCLEPLDGDPAVELDVGGDPHLGHPAVTDPPIEVVSLASNSTDASGMGAEGEGGGADEGMTASSR